jgi:hypothetical protein
MPFEGEKFEEIPTSPEKEEEEVVEETKEKGRLKNLKEKIKNKLSRKKEEKPEEEEINEETAEETARKREEEMNLGKMVKGEGFEMQDPKILRKRQEELLEMMETGVDDLSEGEREEWKRLKSWLNSDAARIEGEGFKIDRLDRNKTEKISQRIKELEDKGKEKSGEG